MDRTAKTMTKSIINIFLSLSLVVATSGVTLSKHYCLGRLVSVSYLGALGGCYENGCENEKSSMPCCDDETTHLKIEELSLSSFSFDSNTSLIVLGFTHLPPTYQSLKHQKNKAVIVNSNSPPPPLSERSLLQVFII